MARTRIVVGLAVIQLAVAGVCSATSVVCNAGTADGGHRWQDAGGKWHEYAVASGFCGDWDAAYDRVGAMGSEWHLATVTSEGEQRFLAGLMSSLNVSGEFWLGGYQGDPKKNEKEDDDKDREDDKDKKGKRDKEDEDNEPQGLAKGHDKQKPDKDWSWVTGESWGFTSWQLGEPNDWNGTKENHLGMWSNYNWNWNDEHGSANIWGYVAERYVAERYMDKREVLQNPEPGTLVLMGTGLLGLARWTRRRLQG